jgi:hypothetical protein
VYSQQYASRSGTEENNSRAKHLQPPEWQSARDSLNSAKVNKSRHTVAFPQHRPLPADRQDPANTTMKLNKKLHGRVESNLII